MASSRVYLILILMHISGFLCQREGYFLPKTIKPVRYNLTIAPDTFDVKSASYYGHLIIELEVLETTKNITVHAKSLTIHEGLITIINERGRRLRLHNTSSDSEKEFYIIHLKEELKKGSRYTLTFGKFTGSLLHDKAGLFYAKYNDAKNTTRYMVITEFEPMDARQTFPCFDEPSLKATFVVNIIREEAFMSASNEELIHTQDLGHGLFRDTFNETVLMPTYLLAFSVSQLKYTKKNDRIRLLVRPDAIEDGSTDYMLDESVKLLKNIEQYTGIPYTLNKLDLVGVPEKYFLDGAMENWGFIVYNEKYLLCSNTSNSMDKQKCATFSGHEFSHQWFGNLVTPKSWQYMWLSEGFAAYFQYFVTALAEPTWRLDEQYVIEEYQSCFRNDIAPLTEPINFIFSEYDTFPSSGIYYYKASAVIRMTEHFMTNDIFVKSLRMYLHKHKFTSTEPTDLFDSYQKAIDDANASYLLGGLTVHQILFPWLTNVGHPIVTVFRNYQTHVITFTQKTFYKDSETDTNIWPIPITYYLLGSSPRDFSDTTTDFWMTKESATVQASLKNDWILVNKHVVGYYRVNYDDENWKRLIRFLKTNNINIIPPTNRAQLLDDTFFLAQCSKLNIELALNLSSYLHRETDYMPIKTFLSNIEELDRSLAGKEEHTLFKTYVKWVLNSSYKKIGLRDRSYDTHVDRLHRMVLAEWMCKLEDFYCQTVGLQYLQLWRTTGHLKISSDLQYSLLCGAVQIATEDEWNFLLQQYYSTKDRNTKTQFIRALGCTDKKQIITRLLDVVYNLNNSITPEDRSIAVGSTMQFSDAGMGIVLKYITDLDVPSDRFKDAFSPVSMIIALPSHHERQLQLIKDKKSSIDLPVFFYTDESLTEEELYFNTQTQIWLRKYSKAIMEKSNLVY